MTQNTAQALPKETLVAYFDIYGFTELESYIETTYVDTIVEIQDSLISHVRQISGCELYFFSDCAFLIYDIHNVKDEALHNSIRTFCDLLRSFYTTFLNKDFLLRGGVAAGPVLSRGNVFIGKPISEAVRLERNGIAPLILFPANKLMPLYGVLNSSIKKYIPMKDNRLLTAMVILPDEPHRIVTLLEKKLEESSYEYSQHGPKLASSISVLRMLLEDLGG
ncbi:hypothetical protein ACFL0Q_00250 [Thermodesulfobacteriota bacterium]